MILNTGNRTDIPAFFSRWFYNRIKEGNVLVRNPYNLQQVTRYELDPETIDCIVFGTKNPEPMLSRLDLLNDFHQFWTVTITPYDRDIEPYVPAKEIVMESFKQLSGKLGVNCVSWRYDPVFLTEKYSMDFHIKTFEEMASNLQGYTDNCVISFLDLYEKTKENFPEGKRVSMEDQKKIVQEFVRIGKKYGIEIRTCAEAEELAEFGADVRGCQTKEILERAVGCPLMVPKSVMTRDECNCILGCDIGAYNTCGHGCAYCYANEDRRTVERNMEEHDPFSPFLVGSFHDGDIIKSVNQESWINPQISFVELLNRY